MGWGTLSLNVNDRELIGWWKAVRKRLQKADRLCFDSVVVLISWFLWKERNNRTFDRVSNSVPQLLSLLLDELIAWFWAGCKRLEPLLLLLGRLSGRELPTV